MYEVSTPEVIVVDRVRRDALASARLDRMLEAITFERMVEVDDAGLAEIVEQRGWRGPRRRTGQLRMTRDPVLIFNTFRWPTPDEAAELAAQYPALAAHMLLGTGAWTFRDHTRYRRSHDYVCQSAWELHCAYGCLHACDYCHIPPYFNIMLNLEELAERVREFGEGLPGQKLYKFDNGTDTICLEPEYGASEIMAPVFADWPERYLLLYTKSDNVDHLLGLEHKGHTLVSWSLNCDTVAERIEKKTPSLDARIAAMEKVRRAGYGVRARISPMCPVKNWREEYDDAVRRILDGTKPDVITVDVVGWMDASQALDALDVSLFDEEYAAFVRRMADEGVRTKGKHLFPHEMRAEMLRRVIGEIRRLRPEVPVSICNETVDMWRELGPMIGMSPENYVCCCGPTCVPGEG